MQVTETTADGLKREFRIVVPADELETKVAGRLDEIGRTIRLPGFRPGKVPMQILRRRYGPSVLGEVLESTVQGSSAEAIREHNLRPALPPKVDIVSFSEGADLEYKMSVEVLPDIPEPEFLRSRDRAARRRGARGGHRQGDRADRRTAAQVGAGRSPGRERRHPRRRCRGPGRGSRDSRAPAARTGRSCSAQEASCRASRTS